jgi:hypothetical protein
MKLSAPNNRLKLTARLFLAGRPQLSLSVRRANDHGVREAIDEMPPI